MESNVRKHCHPVCLPSLSSVAVRCFSPSCWESIRVAVLNNPKQSRGPLFRCPWLKVIICPPPAADSSPFLFFYAFSFYSRSLKLNFLMSGTELPSVSEGFCKKKKKRFFIARFFYFLSLYFYAETIFYDFYYYYFYFITVYMYFCIIYRTTLHKFILNKSNTVLSVFPHSACCLFCCHSHME